MKIRKGQACLRALCGRYFGLPNTEQEAEIVFADWICECPYVRLQITQVTIPTGFED